MNYTDNHYHITLSSTELTGGLVREFQENNVIKWKYTWWGVGKGKKNIIHSPNIMSSHYEK